MQRCQAEIRFALLSISLSSSLSLMEATLNDICYHQDNLCQLHDETANDGLQIVREQREENRDKIDTATLGVLTVTL